MGGATIGCSPACVAPQTCSVVAKCIEPGTCLADGDCGTGMKCEVMPGEPGACVPGGDCGAQAMAADPVPSNLLIVLDRSCSMNTAVAGKTKWQHAVAAIDTLVANYKTKLRFGLILFPDLTAPACGLSGIPIPVSDTAADDVTALLDKTLVTKKVADWYPGDPCVTDIDQGLATAATEPALADTTRQNYVLLVTDGRQTACGTTVAAREAACVKTIADMKAKNVSTFVLGFGSAVDPEHLNDCALAGGVPNAGATKYFDAQDAATLDQALATIAAQAALSCTIELQDTPPDPSKLYVFFDKTTEATRDPTHTNGWDYDPATNRITFYGKACSDLKDGTVKKIDVVFGCKQPPVN
jgi:hypothetical protein